MDHTLSAGEDALQRPLPTVLVDDEPALIASIATELRYAGYRILTASNGRQAPEILGAEPVDLVLADVSMPAMGALIPPH